MQAITDIVSKQISTIDQHKLWKPTITSADVASTGPQ